MKILNQHDQTRTLSPEILGQLKKVGILASLNEQSLGCLEGARERTLSPGEVLIPQGATPRQFWMIVEGSLAVIYSDPDSDSQAPGQTMHVLETGASFGEIQLIASLPSPSEVRAKDRCLLIELNEEQFWNLLTQCPEVRRPILSNLAMRLAKVQSATFQQEKMVTLGTLAAGLMHELNNPGAAARRASTQLRENLLRMHRLTARWARTEHSPEQKECMFDLQERALNATPVHDLDPLAQSDAEEALADWLEQADVEEAWRIAPTFVAAGLTIDDFGCARASLSGERFSDAINWLQAMVSNIQLVATIEESIGRVTELVGAVKSYAYEGRGQKQTLDINRSIRATLVVLGHKLREKQIVLDKSLDAELPPLNTSCTGLNQIWTNLIDNAIDASPQGGLISIKTWSETRQPGQNLICISVCDHGSGVPLESQPHIFDTFYTTKPVGIGTGLGLGIVHRIVEQIGGVILFSSIPGETEFVVRLPATPA